MSTGIRGWATRVLGALCDDWGRQDGSSDALDIFPMPQQMARLAKEVASEARYNAELELDSLIEAAHENMARAHKRRDATARWRQVYTDACILRSLADIFSSDNDGNLDKDVAMSSISRLDHAIIIAGPYGEGRLELILEFISQIQVHTRWDKTEVPFPPSNSHDPEVPRPLLDERTLPTTSFAQSIRRIGAPPSLSAFVSTWFREPFIVTAYVKDWPAMQEHPWRSLDYLRQVAGPGRVVPIEVGSDYRTDDWSQSLMGWDDFLASLEADTTGTSVLYLAQHDLFRQFPTLRDDIVLPDYVYAAPRAPENFPDYRPPANDEQLVVNAWLGPAGTVSPAHTDPFFNLYAQVVGRKTVWLAPPECTPNMHPYPPTANLNDAHTNPAANNVEPSMSNTSQIDVFEPDGTRFPLFSSKVTSQALCATLEPGDLLFFPPGWWHALRSEETSFSVSMWF